MTECFTFICTKIERDWNSWDDKPRTVEEHIEQYREKLVAPKEPEPVDEVERVDLFAVNFCKFWFMPVIFKFSKISGHGTENQETKESLPRSGK